MVLSRVARSVLVAGSFAGVVSLAGTVPAAQAGPPLVVSGTGVALGVGDVVAYGTSAGDGLCAFAGGDYLVKGNAVSVRTTVTEQCTLVIEAIEQAGERPGLPPGAVTPRQPSRAGSALPAPDVTETAGSLPHPDRYAHRLGWVENIVYDEATLPVFSAYDELTFARNLTTGELGAPTYRWHQSWCAGMPYVRVDTPVTARLDLPFRNTVTECTYDLPKQAPDVIELHSFAGYRQSAMTPSGTVYERARFTVMNLFSAYPDTDLNLKNDHNHTCPVVKGQLPFRWSVGCKSDEDAYEAPH